MGVISADTSGIKIHLSFWDFFDFTELDAATVAREKEFDIDPKATAKQRRDNWQRWVQFVVEKQVVKAWNITDSDGKPLDPRKAEDYTKISMYDFARIRMAIALHNKGIADQAKN